MKLKRSLAVDNVQSKYKVDVQELYRPLNKHLIAYFAVLNTPLHYLFSAVFLLKMFFLMNYIIHYHISILYVTTSLQRALQFLTKYVAEQVNQLYLVEWNPGFFSNFAFYKTCYFKTSDQRHSSLVRIPDLLFFTSNLLATGVFKEMILLLRPIISIMPFPFFHMHCLITFPGNPLSYGIVYFYLFFFTYVYQFFYNQMLRNIKVKKLYMQIMFSFSKLKFLKVLLRFKLYKKQFLRVKKIVAYVILFFDYCMNSLQLMLLNLYTQKKVYRHSQFVFKIQTLRILLKQLYQVLIRYNFYFYKLDYIRQNLNCIFYKNLWTSLKQSKILWFMFCLQKKKKNL